MKILRHLAFGFLILNSLGLYGQKTISEGTIIYNIVITPKDKDSKKGSGLTGSTSIIYLKGGLSRTEMVSSLGNEITIHNSKSGSAVILKEYSGQKLMITLNNDNWAERNKKFDGLIFENVAGTKEIEGYNCKKAIAKLKDGSFITVYFTQDLNLMNKDYSQAFKNLPGFPIEYEFETDKLTFKYSLSKIDFNPVAAAKFDFPKSGYRVMTYDENKQGRKND